MTRARAHVFIATSLDGFIARPDGRIDWLLRAQATAPAGEDFGYAEFFAGVQALVMGRASFEQVCTFDSWPYGAMPVHVLSRRGVTVPEPLRASVSVGADAPRALLERLGSVGVRDVYVDGGQVVQAFLEDGLIDTLTVTTIPVLLGAGRPLWGRLKADRTLRLLSSRSWDCGFVQSRYAVEPS